MVIKWCVFVVLQFFCRCSDQDNFVAEGAPFEVEIKDIRIIVFKQLKE